MAECKCKEVLERFADDLRSSSDDDTYNIGRALSDALDAVYGEDAALGDKESK